MRQKKREVKIGNVTIGGSNPIAVQTMLNVPVEDIEGNVAQAKRCEAAGCQILRVTCPSPADAKCIEAVKNAVNIPIVADIHFDYKAALACADIGVDKIRINPGNIGDDDRVKAVVDACQQKNIPIRIGVNGGSLEKHILARYGAPTPEAMVESALYHVRLLEKFDFNNIVISIKNSNVPRMMEAYRQLSAVTDYPLHVGVTEAGTYQMGLLKSGMGIGGMLLEGIGDTIRVSLAAEPEKEVEAGFNILRAVGFPVTGPEVITCPTCGRTQYPCTEIANEVEKRLRGAKYVQSDLDGVFREIREVLKTRPVLFSGTPCQVDGLYRFLGCRPENLTTCDLVCHGVPSPGVWEDEARFIEGNKRRRLANVRFRNKVEGWKNSHFTAVYDDGTADSAPLFATGFGRAFGRALFLRQSCHDCQYTNLNRPGDFTLGDLWGLRPDEFPEQQHAGVSLLLVNTPHGSYLFDQLKLNCQPFPVERAVAGNPRLARPIGPAADRASFFASYAVEPFEEVRRQFFRLPSLPVRAAGKLLSPEAKAKLKAKLHR